MFANTEAWHMEVFYGTGTHTLTFNMPTPIEQQDVSLNGISIFMSCYGILKETESILRFIEMFINLNKKNYEVPDYMANTDR